MLWASINNNSTCFCLLVARLVNGLIDFFNYLKDLKDYWTINYV